MTWSTRYALAETLIFVGVVATYFAWPDFFPLGFFVILSAAWVHVPGWVRWQGKGFPPISLKTARESLAMEMCGLTVAVTGEAIKMDRRILSALIAAAILLGYVLGRWVWGRAM